MSRPCSGALSGRVCRTFEPEDQLTPRGQTSGPRPLLETNMGPCGNIQIMLFQDREASF